MPLRNLAVLCIVVAAFLSPAAALSYSPAAYLSWPEVVADSEFVGVIECVRAGAQVSEFTVIAPWKGTIAPPHFRMRWSSRVGDRYLAGLSPQRPGGTPYLDNLDSLLQPIGGMEGRLGLWPEGAADYGPADRITVSIFPLEAGTTGEVGGTSRYSGGTETPFETMKDQAQAVVDSSGEAREFLLIMSALHHMLTHFPSEGGGGLFALERSGPANLDTLLAVVFDPDNGIDRQRILWAIGRAGREETLARLKAWRYEHEKDRAWLTDVITYLERHEASRAMALAPWKPQPPRDDLGTRAARRALKHVPESRGSFPWEDFRLWCDAFAVMTARNPQYVAKYLQRFDPGIFYGELAGQNLAAWYATRVGKERSRCFQTLATAEHPGIALTGGAFLLHEDPDRGARTLRAWAAGDGPLRRAAAELLIAHGRKEYVPVMIEPGGHPYGTGITWGTRAAALAALSNAAHAAGRPQPPQWIYRPEDPEDPLIAWWRDHGSKLTLAALPVAWPPLAE